jgi:CheY-like chemotaxis protein
VTTQQVLIADDDRDLTRVLALRVQDLGLVPLVANDALSALNLIHRQRPEVVLLDVNMPAGNGLSVCEMLASDPRLAAIPVVVLTGRSDEETIRRCQTMCAYYVLKSTDVWERLEPLLRELLAIDEPEPAISFEAHRPLRGPRSRGLGELCRIIAGDGSSRP